MGLHGLYTKVFSLVSKDFQWPDFLPRHRRYRCPTDVVIVVDYLADIDGRMVRTTSFASMMARLEQDRSRSVAVISLVNRRELLLTEMLNYGHRQEEDVSVAETVPNEVDEGWRPMAMVFSFVFAF